MVHTNAEQENELQIGNDIKNIEAVRWMLKTQFDKNIVTQFDVQETIFDHIFNHLGINSFGCIDHPIVLTEPVCNPSYSRQLMSELLFECYKIPQVAYGVDSLFSFYFNHHENFTQNGLIVSLSYHTIHILPFLNRRLDIHNVKRINIGGHQMVNFLQRILQLKYPMHSSAISPSRAEVMLHEHTYFSLNYSEEIKKWAIEDYYKENMHIIQLPFKSLPGSVSGNKISKIEKCHSLLKRVQAMRLKQRDEKLAYDEELLQEYVSVQEILDDDEAILALQELGFTSAAELQAGIKKLNCNIQKIKSLIASQHDDPQDSPLKDWCEELNLNNFTDADNWINAVKQKRKEVFEARQKLASDKLKNTPIGGFSSTTASDLFGGIFFDPAQDQSFQEYTNELIEKKEQIKILDEILTEYNRELSNDESNFSYNLSEYYQLHLGQERIRVPEIVFQPSLIGVEQAGLGEAIEFVLSNYNTIDQQKIVENILITGGCALIPNIRDRLEAEILAFRPFQSKFNVSLSNNPQIDAWKGAKLWTLTSDNLEKNFITRQEYEEKGGDYLKEHSYSNYYAPIPTSLRKGLLNNDVTCPIKTDKKSFENI